MSSSSESEELPVQRRKKTRNFKYEWTKFNKDNPHAFRKKPAAVVQELREGQLETSVHRGLSNSELARNNASVTLIYDPDPEPELDENSEDYLVLKEFYDNLFPGYSINEDRRYFKNYAMKYNRFFPNITPDNLVFYAFVNGNEDPANTPGYEPILLDTNGNQYNLSNVPRYPNGAIRLSDSPDTAPYWYTALKYDTLTDGCAYTILAVNFRLGEDKQFKNYKIKIGPMISGQPIFYIQVPVNGELINLCGTLSLYPPETVPGETAFGKRKVDSEEQYLRSFI